jgi:hypothetical protein
MLINHIKAMNNCAVGRKCNLTEDDNVPNNKGSYSKHQGSETITPNANAGKVHSQYWMVCSHDGMGWAGLTLQQP